jgi:hypothetical protein
LRYKKDAPPAMLVMPGGIVFSVAAVVFSVWLLANSKSIEAKHSAIAVGVGILIYVLYRLKSSRET